MQSFPEQGRVDKKLLPGQMKSRDVLSDVEQAPNSGCCLGNHRGHGGARHTQGNDRHKKHIQKDIHAAAEGQEIHRGFGVPQPPQGGSQHIILEGEEKAHKADPKIGFRLSHGFLRRLNPAEQLPGQDQPQNEYPQGKEKTKNEGGGKFLLDFFFVLCAPEFADHHRGPQTDAGGTQHQDGEDGVGGAHRCQGGFSQKFADDDGIHGVVGQLQEVAQDHGNGKMDQVGEDTPLGHILHGKYFFLYLG